MIKGLSENEGTTVFTHIELKTGEKSVMRSGSKTYEYSNSGVVVFDTRGQILLDEIEKSHLELMMEGKVKKRSKIENREYRYAYLLFEFWKKDSELFPSSILTEGATGLESKPHCIIFVFDGSLEEVPNGEEEVEFYRGVLQKCRERSRLWTLNKSILSLR